MNAISSRKSVRIALVMAALAVPVPALATNRFYAGPSGGLWNTPSNWTGSAVPVNGDSAVIGSNTDLTVTFDGNYAPPGLFSFDLDGNGFATATLNHFSAGVMQISVQEHIGYNGRGHYIQSQGANNSPSLTLGVSAGSNGQYDLSGGTVSATEFWIGYVGVGTLTQTGGGITANVLRLGATPTGNGTYTMSNGSLNSGSIENGLFGTGYLQQQGGNATLGNLFNGKNGSYNLSGGSLSLTGTLFNDGTFSQSGGTFSGNVTNNNNISFSTGTFTVNSGGMVNYNQFGIYGGTFVLNGTSTNQGYMQFSGNTTISGSAAFNNLASITQTSGTLTLNGGAVTNSGNMQLALGGGLNLNSVNFTNNGTLTLNGARIGGSASLINRFGATISGNGLIASGFDNQGGRLLLTSGTTLILNPFNNSGIIQLADDAASLGGGAITNSGEVVGHGIIQNQISSLGGGMIEASGGTLTLGGVVNNGAGGILSAPAGGKLFFAGGLTTSGGLINLSGGYFDNNTSPINNTGQISGFGTIRTGGLANNGSVTLTGGFTTVNGAVTNSATKQIKVAYDPALFTGNVTNNGIFKTTSTTVTFSGAYTENGTFISDPSDNYFFDVFLNAPGAWTGGVGDRFFVKGTLDWSGGSMNGSGAQTFNQGSATLHDVGVKTLNGWTFNNEKPLTMSGGNIDMGNSAVINNTSSFEIQGSAGITNTLGGAATFANQGTLRKTGARTISSIAALVTNNNGNIDVPTGILSLDGGLNIAAATTLPKTGAGNLTISGPQSHGVGAQFTASSGSIHLNSDAGAPATAGAAASARLTLNVSGDATVALGGNQDLKELNIPIANAGNQSLDLSTPGTPGAFNAIRIYSADLATAKTTLWSAIKNANGPGSLTPVDGIFDSGKIGHAGSGIGLARINDAHGDSHIQIRLARTGDLNLDGSVTISDFIDLASNFNTSGPSITWQEGDLNYDGQVTISDFIDLASNFGSTYSGQILPTSASDHAILSNFAASINVNPSVIGSAVPEPGIFGTSTVLALMLNCRRRKSFASR